MAYSTIPKGSLHMNPVIYTGNGSADRAITGAGFAPNWVWIKKRSSADVHYIFDSVRGADIQLQSNSNAAQYDYSGDANRSLTAFDSDGFTLGTNEGVNHNSQTFVSWNWKENGTGSSNTNGSITSTVSANATAGFSIVKWTGSGANATVGHGLGVTPSMLIVKNATGTGNWRIWNQNLSSAQTLELNATSGALTSAGQFNSSATFNSNVFSVGGEGDTNESSSTIVAYCFSEIKGFSKFGTYVGNGSTDGTFVYTGFKPAFILQKRYDNNGEGWGMFDTTRSPINESKNMLLANSNALEDTSNAARIDFLSNGFKWRTTDTWFNPNGGSCIYMAFAENPFVATSGTSAIPVTAR